MPRFFRSDLLRLGVGEELAHRSPAFLLSSRRICWSAGAAAQRFAFTTWIMLL
jgi:hypothetical protein